MRLGLFGGSFDPIHRGHIQPVQEARRELGLDRVVFLPTALPPHKQEREFAPPLARFAMVELALLHEVDLLVSPLELTPGRPAYTVDSVRRFQAEHPDAELFLLIGGDSLAELHTWKSWQAIPQLARLAVLSRPDWRWEEVRERVPREIAELGDGGRVHFVPNQPVETSATRLRSQLARGEWPATGVIPELVLEYIRKYSLYR